MTETGCIHAKLDMNGFVVFVIHFRIKTKKTKKQLINMRNTGPKNLNSAIGKYRGKI